jgi:hypothetical protein
MAVIIEQNPVFFVENLKQLIALAIEEKVKALFE